MFSWCHGTRPCTLVMSASPAATPVTAPLAVTVAAALFDEDQLAVLVTDTVVPSDNVAVAENCVVVPT